MTVTVNPTKFSINDPNITLENVTSFKILVGTTTGGPYTFSSATVSLSALTAGPSGVESGPFSFLSFTPPLQTFTTYFAIVEAQNAQGLSVGSPEGNPFSLEAPPSAPTALVFS